MLPGGGATEMLMAQAVEEASKKVAGMQVLALEAFARALPYCTLKTIHLGSTNFSRWGKELLRELPHVRAGRVAVRGVGFGQPVQERRDQCF